MVFLFFSFELVIFCGFYFVEIYQSEFVIQVDAQRVDVEDVLVSQSVLGVQRVYSYGGRQGGRYYYCYQVQSSDYNFMQRYLVGGFMNVKVRLGGFWIFLAVFILFLRFIWLRCRMKMLQMVSKKVEGIVRDLAGFGMGFQELLVEWSVGRYLFRIERVVRNFMLCLQNLKLMGRGCKMEFIRFFLVVQNFGRRWGN